MHEEPEYQLGGIDLISTRPTAAEVSLSIGTLSWSVPRRRYDRLPTEPFLSALKQLVGQDERVDLLLVSGRTLACQPDPRELADKASGMPVLFEVAKRDGSAQWLMAHGSSPGFVLVRESQILVRSNDDEDTYRRLVAEVIAGHGVIRLAGSGLTLVLLICGENNALRCDHRNLSALYYPSSGLRGALGSHWIALNPAHSPYWPQSKMTGFAKVGKVGGVGETMARAVARSKPFDDGTIPPVAFIHANNFFADETKTVAYASVAFGPHGKMTPIRTFSGSESVRDGGSLQWIFSVFEVPVK